MEDLKSKKWDKIACKVEWEPGILKPTYYSPRFRATHSESGIGEHCAMICIRCEEVYPLEPCPNCGSEGFIPGLTTEGYPGIFCFECQRGFSSWKCENCGTINPINKSLGKLKGGCFIATAVYGNDNAIEVIVLKQMRDNYLLHSGIGKFLVNVYYHFSPPIAKFLCHYNLFRRMVRVLLIHPSVMLCKKLVREKK